MGLKIRGLVWVGAEVPVNLSGKSLLIVFYRARGTSFLRALAYVIFQRGRSPKIAFNLHTINEAFRLDWLLVLLKKNAELNAELKKMLN